MSDPRSKSCLEIFRARVTEPVDAALSIGDRRSPEYRTGMLDAVAFRELRMPIPQPCRYQAGTSQFDAYFAGVERGHALWRKLHPSGATSNSLSINNQEHA